MADFKNCPQFDIQQTLHDFPQYDNHAVLSLVNQLKRLEARVRALESVLKLKEDGSVGICAHQGIELLCGGSQITLSKQAIQLDAQAIHLNAPER